jgi:hypothetical protein
MLPLQFQIYKGKGGRFGAAQFSLKDAKLPVDLKDKGEEGVMFLNITSATGPDNYDWANKIVLALSIEELGGILHVMSAPVQADGKTNEYKITHDPGAGSDTKGQTVKGLYISAPKGPLTGIMLTATENKDGVTKKHTVPVTSNELMVLKALFEAAIPRMLGW